MRPERERAESLHGPWPSTIEELQAKHGEKWDIWRELKETGRHGDWIAKSLDEREIELRAECTDDLRILIEKADRQNIQISVESVDLPLTAKHLGNRRPISPAGIDVSTPNVARMYDFLLGGKDHYAADREASARVLATVPDARLMANANRAFLGGAVRFLAAEAGIGQFLDIGSGLPTRDNVHEVAQRFRPGAEVVYVDHDPVVLAHARALLATNEHTHVCWGDLRDPRRILEAAGEFLDLDRPVAVLLVAVLHFLPDGEGPYEIVSSLMDAVAPGSYLVISHGERTPELVEAGKAYEKASAQVALRSEAEICRFFEGLDLVGRGAVRLPQWSPGEAGGAGCGEIVSIYDEPVTSRMPVFCGVGVKR